VFDIQNAQVFLPRLFPGLLVVMCELSLQEWSGIAMSDDGSKMLASAAKIWISGAAGAIAFDFFHLPKFQGS
jgi:hypothetical protein